MKVHGLEALINEAVHRFYSAALGERDWPSALDPLLDAVGFDGAALYVFDRESVTLDIGTNPVVMGLWHRLDPSAQADYARHYIKLDPRVQFYLANPTTRILHDYLHTPEAQIDRDPYYAWYLRNQTTRYYVGGHTQSTLPFFGGITLHRRRTLGPVQQFEIDRFNLLFDHLERALLVEYQLFRANRYEVARPSLENNAAGVVLLDSGGRVVHANDAANTMAARGDGLLLSGAGLRAVRPEDNASLQRVLAAALQPTVNRSPPPPLALRRSSGDRDYYWLVAAPLPTRDGLFASFAPAVHVVIVDPACTPRPPAELMRSMFGLTEAELRLAALLAMEYTVEDAARQSGVAVATIRSQLASLFRKTDTRRQAELVRLLTSVPWSTLSHVGRLG